MNLSHKIFDESHPRCDPGNLTAIYLLSKLCVNGSNIDGAYDCFDKSMEKCPYRNGLGVWAIVIIFIGVSGNLLTLLAIPYAARHRRYFLENYLIINYNLVIYFDNFIEFI